jgi:hypothetical protein
MRVNKPCLLYNPYSECCKECSKNPGGGAVLWYFDVVHPLNYLIDDVWNRWTYGV